MKFLILLGTLSCELRADKRVRDFLGDYCIRCHNPEGNKGELDLEIIYEESITGHPEIWEKMVTRIESRDMPPVKARKRPLEKDYAVALETLPFHAHGL